MSWRAHLLLFLLLVPTFNTLAVLALPGLINRYVMHRIVEDSQAGAGVASSDARIQAQRQQVLQRGAVNVALPAPRSEAGARTVVRPSPDLLYTACVFDLRAGPLHIVAPVPGSYLSISGFAADTSNFFAVNDSMATTRADGAREIKLLIGLHAPNEMPPDVQWVQSPSERGLILFRMLIADEAALPVLQAQFQAQQRCEPQGLSPESFAVSTDPDRAADH